MPHLMPVKPTVLQQQTPVSGTSQPVLGQYFTPLFFRTLVLYFVQLLDTLGNKASDLQPMAQRPL